MKFRKQRGGSDQRRFADPPDDAPQGEPSDDELSVAFDHALRRAQIILARRRQQTSSSPPAESVEAVDSANDLIN
jgi:hypothetical protein